MLLLVLIEKLKAARIRHRYPMETPQSPANSEIIIEANRSYWTVDWRELWEYRDLTYLLVRRDFISRYKQTILGPLWFIIQPVLMTLIFTVIFSRIAEIGTAGAPPSLFYMCGLMGWNLGLQNFTTASNIFISNSNILNKVYFPRLLLPIASTISNLPNLIIALMVFLFYFAIQMVRAAPNPGWGVTECVWLTPLIFLHICLIAVSIGVWTSVLTVKYRDLTHALGFITQLWMYATPVIYPLSKVPSQHLIWFYFNPMAAPVELLKSAFLGTTEPPLGMYAASIAITLCLMVSAIFVFQKTQGTFVDSL